MKLLAARLCAVHRARQHFVAEELAGLNVMIDKRNVHTNHAARSKIEVTNFGISHYPFRKTDARAVRGEQSLGILLADFVVEGLRRHRDRVAFVRRRVAPAVDYYEREWTFSLWHRLQLQNRERFSPLPLGEGG